MFIPAIAVPEGILLVAFMGITDPSDIVIPPSIDIEEMADCRAEFSDEACAAAAVGLSSQAIVTGGADGD
jgi:hypothetical protein